MHFFFKDNSLKNVNITVHILCMLIMCFKVIIVMMMLNKVVVLNQSGIGKMGIRNSKNHGENF